MLWTALIHLSLTRLRTGWRLGWHCFTFCSEVAVNRLLIKGGRVVDPAGGIDGLFDVYAIGGKIAAVKPYEPSAFSLQPNDWTVIDATGLIVCPGFIDMHVHLREPGYEYKETIKTGAMAAAAGGFTGVACMANTDPVNDNASVTRYILKKAQEEGIVNVYPVGAVSRGLKGESMAEIGELKEAGCVAVSDDGRPVINSGLMRLAMEYAKLFNMLVISHCEDTGLSAGGQMNEGIASTRLGLKGIPVASEDIMVARDIAIAELTGCRLHIAHISTVGAIELVRLAKNKGLKVTAEVTPHHFTLTDQAPQDITEKEVEFDKAANGIIGLETALPLSLRLVSDNMLSMAELVKKLSANPARLLGLDCKGTLKVGADADIAIVDLEKEWVVDARLLKSKSKNTPFDGWKMKGKVVKTIVAGKVVYEEET